MIIKLNFYESLSGKKKKKNVEGVKIREKSR